VDSELHVVAHNRAAWDYNVGRGNRWTVPVSSEEVAAAQKGRWVVLLTPGKPVPRAWFGELAGKDVLCLASGGGQQGPILAAAGARVTVYDNSPRQLAQDRAVAERDGLTIRAVLGDMADLSAFADESFDLIFHPVSNTFVADVLPVWREAYRVLRRGGVLLAGFTNPDNYVFDWELGERTGLFQARYRLPYADVSDLPPEELAQRVDEGWPLEFSHTWEAQIGGQLEAGFHLVGFYEDADPNAEDDPLSAYMATYMATRAVKP